MPMEVRKEQIRVGRVIEEDENSVTLHVLKSDLASYDLDNGQPKNFVTLLFVQTDGEGGIKFDFPWDLKPPQD